MEQYCLGQKIHLDAEAVAREFSANRMEVRRPDGSTIGKDWDRRGFQLKANQLGIWSWRIYIREGNSTKLQTGQFEVVPGNEEERAEKGEGRLSRLRRGR